MPYLALATDYDGTIATEGQVEPETLAALERWRTTGRQLILITGRMLDDLLTILPRYAPLELFAWIVAENGAVLYHPASAEVKLLTTPPPQEFVQQLRARIGDGAKIWGEMPSGEFAHLIQTGQLNSFSMGRIIVATWQPYEQEAEELIQAMGLPLQIIMNKRAVMILPQGIDKAFGLKAALQELNLSSEQVVGVGDAENDCHFLELCGFSAAVANALPMVKDQVDWVALQARGAGVVELVEYLLREGGDGRRMAV
jgi:HAD superfamily hydrolase (TIGR01484 family)